MNPKSKFIRVRCGNGKCKHEQIIFSNAATQINCLMCQEVLAKPTGGKATIKANILEVLE